MAQVGVIAKQAGGSEFKLKYYQEKEKALSV
jgi:hypothetical protein